LSASFPEFNGTADRPEARATPELPCRVEEGPVTPSVRPANPCPIPL